jgi:cytochrome c-type biogenesis protein
MGGLIGGIVAAFWLGILTSFSPCPLTTNIAAISFIGKNGKTKNMLLSGLLYSFGRMSAYAIVGAIVTMGILSIPGLSFFLQKNLNKFLGIILIIAGMLMLEIINLNFRGLTISEKFGKESASQGYWGAYFLGFIFALAFCPVSAALFFGSLIPLAVLKESKILLPMIFGLGTGLPVLVFAFILSKSVSALGNIFNKAITFELWFRRGTGVIFIIIGVIFVLKYIFGVQFNI